MPFSSHIFWLHFGPSEITNQYATNNRGYGVRLQFYYQSLGQPSVHNTLALNTQRSVIEGFLLFVCVHVPCMSSWSDFVETVGVGVRATGFAASGSDFLLHPVVLSSNTITAHHTIIDRTNVLIGPSHLSIRSRSLKSA